MIVFWGKLSWQNINPLALGLLFLSTDRRRDEPHCPAPTCPWPFPTSPVVAGWSGVTYIEFFILGDDFSVGEDGGRRAFGEWISWKDKSRQVGLRTSFLGHMVICLFIASCSHSSSVHTADTNEYLSVHRARLAKHYFCLSVLILFVCFWYENQEPYIHTNIKERGPKKAVMVTRAEGRRSIYWAPTICQALSHAVALNSHNSWSPCKVFSLYLGGSWDSERFSYFSKVTQEVSGIGRIWIQVWLLLNPMFFPLHSI